MQQLRTPWLDPGRVRTALAAGALAAATCAAAFPGPALSADPAQPTGVAGGSPYALVLGIAQDAGVPQAGCSKSCCARAWDDPTLRRHVACLAIVDPESGERWLIDATPDFPAQLHTLDGVAPPPARSDGSLPPPPALAGILLTHAHIGHYTGLMDLGREVMGAHAVPVLVLPRMQQFLSHNGPWDQLVTLQNIVLVPMHANQPVRLGSRVSATPLLVPHRDEYSETAGFLVHGPHRTLAWIPDIDKWERFDTKLSDLLAQVDVAFLDGTFYANGEIEGRDMSEIPHPFIQETLRLLASLPASERAKVHFVHLNHTNPALAEGSDARRTIERADARVAREGERIGL